jgi:von Willebrand factor type A domain
VRNTINMRAKLTILSALAVGMTAGLIAGCQTYDFEPVDPLALGQTTVLRTVEAKNVKPNMMLLVDTSLSMNDPASAGSSTTRWTELKGAMNAFLSANGSKARFGLTNYPADNVCAPAGQTQVRFDIPTNIPDTDVAGLQARANAINAKLAELTPVGGTPTSESVRFVGALPSLNEANRGDFIILLTDGLPNCNPENPVSGETDAAACQCTVTASACTEAPPAGATDFRRLGCLDRTVSAQRIAELKSSKEIGTLVIGFGALLSGGTATDTLNDMAEAGGYAQPCAPGETCTKFYRAANQAELTAALEKIINRFEVRPCLVGLTPDQMPSDSRLLVVKITDSAGTRTATQGTEYNITAEGVEFIGATCASIESSTTENPVTLEVFAVQQK